MKTPAQYSTFAMLLHWLMAFLIFTLFGLGWYMTDLPKDYPDRAWFFALHKSVGLTVACLALLRLGWRAAHAPPALPDTIKRWQRRLAHATHHLLYVFMFLQPVSGYISSSFSGHSTLFWGIPLPEWGWQDKILKELFAEVHAASSVALLTLVILHVLGALHHGWGREDSVLQRMVPGKW